MPYRSSPMPFGLLPFALALAAPLAAQQEGGDKEVGLSGTVMVPHVSPAGSTVGLINPRFGYFLGKRHYAGVDNANFVANGFQSYDFSFLYRYYFSTRNPRFYPFVGAAPGVAFSREPTTREFEITDDSIASFQAQVARLPVNQRDPALRAADAAISRFYQDNEPQDIKRSVTNETFRVQIGFKSFLNRKFAFEVAYNLMYRNLRTAEPHIVYSDLVLGPNNTVRLQPAAAQNVPHASNSSLTFADKSASLFTFGFSYLF